MPSGLSATRCHSRGTSLSLRVLERGLAPLRVREREPATADLRVQLVLDPVDLARARIRLRPEVARVGRMAAELEADQMILLVVVRRARPAVLAHLHELQRAGVARRRPDGLRPALPADGRPDR